MLSTLRQVGVRAYSTSSPTPLARPNSGPLKWIAIGGAGLGVAYMIYNSKGISPLEAKQLEDKAKSALAEVTGTTLSPQAALSPEEWRNFKLQKVIPYNHNTSTFVFELPKNVPSGLTVASALVTKSFARDGEMACVDEKGKPVIRPYTPVTPPAQQDTLHLLVKNYPDGKMTNHIFSLKPGDQLALKGPIPKWPYKANQFKTIGMIAGGSGITPHWQIIQEIASNPDDHTKVIMFFSNQKEEDILLREEFESLQKQKPDQFSFNFVLDSPPKNWSRELKGYLSSSLLKSKLPSPKLGEDVKIFVCGPPGQVSAVSGPKKGKEQGELGGILKELGYTEDQVYKF